MRPACRTALTVKWECDGAMFPEQAAQPERRHSEKNGRGDLLPLHCAP